MARKDDVMKKLQPRINEIMGKTISIENCWILTQAVVAGIVDCCLDDLVTKRDEGNPGRFSIPALGRMEIFKAKPRKSKIGQVEFVPKVKFRSSDILENKIALALGVQMPPKEGDAAPKVATVAAPKEPKTPKVVKAPAVAKVAPPKTVTADEL